MVTVSDYQKPNPEDFLRFGIIEYELGQYDSSWQHVLLALLQDKQIETRKHAYQSYIYRIIRKKFGKRINIPRFIELLRRSK